MGLSYQEIPDRDNGEVSQSNRRTPSAMLLQATEITKRFGHRTVLNGINLEVHAGQVVCIFGPNGAGKTTLIKILSTLVRPTSGGLQVGGVDAVANAMYVRPTLGVMVHEPLAYLELTPYENLRFFGKLYGVDALHQRITALLNVVGLTQFTHEQMKFFSRGMTQRFMIAKALIHDPLLLFFDEPFSGLDANAKRLLLKRIEFERSHGKGIVLTTHDTELGYVTGSRFLFLINGTIETVATKDEIKADELSRRYEKSLMNLQIT